ncbi:MAG: amidohydrolase family protein [Candidatus Hodarchaeales archaeon]
MKFSIDKPLLGLKETKTGIWDAHFHLWDDDAYLQIEESLRLFDIKKITGIAGPDAKIALEKAGRSDSFVFAYYLPPNAFADHDFNQLLDHVEKAHSLGYPMVKMWFGPRFLDFSNAVKPFRIDHPSFEPVYSLIEDHGLRMDVHVADPDPMYRKMYMDEKYRTKEKAIEEFSSVLEKYPSIKTIGIHFGCLPEHLGQLGNMLDKFPNFYIDTASTRWIVRELGKDVKKSRDFITKYQKRILFATDLSVGWGDHPEDYIATRLWSQRLFWETNVQNVDLPFPDNDNDGKTTINGLNLSQSILDCLYWKNAENFFN